MTRINVGIHPRELHDKHLIAEHREIKRIPNAIKSGRAIIKDIPDDFRLGSGHVKFFYNKLGYLLERYRSLYEECIRRGFNVTDFSGAWNGVPNDLMNDYKPTDRDVSIVRERINTKLKNIK